MSKKRTYEEIDQRMSELPLPEQEAAWQKMKKKLEQDDDRRRIIPPVFLNCAAWSALFLVLLAGAWLILRPERWWQEKTIATQKHGTPTIEKGSSISPEKNETDPYSDKSVKEEQINSPTVTAGTSSATTNVTTAINTSPDIKNSSVAGKTKSTAEFRSNRGRVGSNPGIESPGPEIEKASVNVQITNATIAGTEAGANHLTTGTHDTTLAQINKELVPTKDSGSKTEIVTTSTDSQKKTGQSKKKFFVSVGLGEQLQIPIAGQTTVPYSYYGRNGSVSDYIPSVYVRLHREQKWYVQAEFRYGAAQSVKEFSFSQQTKYDTSSMNVVTTTMRLKKTYYHQLPLTFNYMVRPNLSVGIGGMYSRFYGAITEEEIKSRNIQTQSETLFKQIVPLRHFTDSFLYRSQVHFLLQADYQWRALSFGLRYTRDLQPYIKFTHPDGTIDEEKNQSLQLIVRLRLWKSK
jgi:hypothetical protein